MRVSRDTGMLLAAGRPVLRRSNHITVEVNPAIHGVNRMVNGLFAVDEETGHTVLLHRGHIGGSREGIGKTSFMEWYTGTQVGFFDPSRDDGEESAVLVADLESSEFLIQLEAFVDAVHRFKAAGKADNPARMSDAELIQGRPPKLRRSRNPTRAASVVYERHRYVAELCKAQSGRQMRIVQNVGALHQCVERTVPGVPPHRLACSRGSRQYRQHCRALSELSPKNACCERCEGHQEAETSCREGARWGMALTGPHREDRLRCKPHYWLGDA